jgi:hypothetical protein
VKDALLALALLLAACGSTSVPPRPITAEDFVCGDGGVITTEQLTANVISLRCTHACHNSADAEGAPLIMVSPDDVQALAVGHESRYSDAGELFVVNADGGLETSAMWLKVLGGSPRLHGPNGEPIGQQMPLGGSLNEPDLQQIKRWICAGAPR